MMESFLSWASEKFAEWWSNLKRDTIETLLVTFFAMMMITGIGLFASVPFLIYFGGTSPEEMYEYYKVLNDAPGEAGQAYREDLREWLHRASLDEQVEFLRLTSSEGEE